MKTYKKIVLTGFSLVMFACNNEPTLQEYYVENQEDSKFIAVDVPTSLFTNAQNLEPEQKATLESVKKVNVLAYPLEEGNEKGDYETEKIALEDILQNGKYQLLMKYGSLNRRAEIYFTGDEDAIDELVVFGYDDEKGMGVARILGNDMNPQKLMELAKSMEEGDLDFSGFKGLGGIFNDSDNKEDKGEDQAEQREMIEEQEEGSTE